MNGFFLTCFGVPPILMVASFKLFGFPGLTKAYDLGLLVIFLIGLSLVIAGALIRKYGADALFILSGVFGFGSFTMFTTAIMISGSTESERWTGVLSLLGNYSGWAIQIAIAILMMRIVIAMHEMHKEMKKEVKT